MKVLFCFFFFFLARRHVSILAFNESKTTIRIFQKYAQKKRTGVSMDVFTSNSSQPLIREYQTSSPGAPTAPGSDFLVSRSQQVKLVPAPPRAVCSAHFSIRSKHRTAARLKVVNRSFPISYSSPRSPVSLTVLSDQV